MKEGEDKINRFVNMVITGSRESNGLSKVPVGGSEDAENVDKFYVVIRGFYSNEVHTLELPKYNDDIEDALTELFEFEPSFVSTSMIKCEGDMLEGMTQEGWDVDGWPMDLKANAEDDVFDKLMELLYG